MLAYGLLISEAAIHSCCFGGARLYVKVQFFSDFAALFLKFFVSSLSLFIDFEVDIWTERLIECGDALCVLFNHITNAHHVTIFAEPALFGHFLCSSLLQARRSLLEGVSLGAQGFAVSGVACCRL